MHWEEPGRLPVLGKDEVHVWRASLDMAPASIRRALTVLSADERRRADRFRFSVHGDRFVAARAVLRGLLGHYLELPPSGVPLCAGPTGRPVLPSDFRDGGVEFNLTHSGDRTLIAVARDRAVGVDLERLRRGVAHERLADRFFTPSEAEALRDVPPAVRPIAFFACWTRKEAFLKATGTGLQHGLPHALREFAVTVSPFEPPEIRQFPGGTRRWSLTDLDVGAGYAAALAVEGNARMRLFEWVG